MQLGAQKLSNSPNLESWTSGLFVKFAADSRSTGRRSRVARHKKQPSGNERAFAERASGEGRCWCCSTGYDPVRSARSNVVLREQADYSLWDADCLRSSFALPLTATLTEKHRTRTFSGHRYVVVSPLHVAATTGPVEPRISGFGEFGTF